MGVRGESYLQSFESPFDADEIMQRFVAGTAGSRNYTVSPAGTGTLILTRRYIPTWAIIVAVLGAIFFLVGLLALLVRETETVTITIRTTATGSSVAVSGTADGAMSTRLSSVISSLKGSPGSIRGTAHVVTTLAPGIIGGSVGRVGSAKSMSSRKERVFFLTDVEKVELKSVPGPAGQTGWYPDPLGAAAERYWNVDHWTGRVREGLEPSPIRPAAARETLPSSPSPEVRGPVASLNVAGSRPEDLLESLTRLHELHRSGGVTDEEFAELKRRMLDQG